MKYLYTKTGEQIIVDDEDYEHLSQFKWFIHTGGYAICNHSGSRYMHRILMGDIPKGMYVDHINRNTLDNRKSNLRICNPSQSQRNSAKPKGEVKYRGVTYDERKKKFQARIKIDKVHKHIGLFHTAWEAAVAYNIFARIYHGEFAILNEVDESVLNEITESHISEMFLPTSRRFLRKELVK